MTITSRRPRLLAVVLCAILSAATVPEALAEDDEAARSRAEVLRRAREQKAQSLAPPKKPSIATRFWDFAESTYGPSAAQYNGFVPWIGSVVSGGGFAVGARYRNTLLFDRRARLDVGAIGSTKRYYRALVRFEAPRLGGSPFFVSGDLQALEYTQEDFFGLGPDSQRSDRTNFLYDEFRTGARVGAELLDRVQVGGSLSFLNPRVGRGRDSAYPSIEDSFTDAEAPGLAAQPTFVITSAFLDWNRVGEPERARSGQRVQVTFTNAHDQSDGRYSYRQLDVDARQFFPFYQGKRVFVVRGWYSTAFTDSNEEMPFYLQPFLGGRRTLRGYDDQRFRGPHLLLLQAEYRFEVWPALDMALFVDAGTVAQRRGELDFSGMERDYGVSFRFGGENAIFRLDLAFGGETRRVSLAFGDVF